ncbi:hypothetical protein GCM10011608_09180 [Micromonospora sonchi]|uniref:Uncharacterized protein n=1 Tax=Micromonospora sonchi TaxID=1763543 RepID=A0A917WT55_9ACTN|nr:hypothetical protein [Micromonospora sonchi]GGM26561.1 hypothetical protein GCM10011608_09180 [Micromonospora sonchi]
MNGQVLRLAPTSPGRPVVEVPIGPGDLPDAELRLVRWAKELPSVKAGRRTVEIVPVGGDAA